ncbi:MAG: TIM44-like domain-containing protein [Beijerinckiaceae bacterium]
MSRHFGRIAMALFAAIITLGLSAEFVDAKPGRGSNSGSRGSRTDTSVPSTPTAPRATTGAPSSPAANPAGMPGRAAATAAQAAKPSMMSTMAKGFAMGLIGAGLFGLLTGSGLFGGLSGIAGFLGLLLQVALIALAVRLIWGFFKNRQAANQPQAAGPAGYARAPSPERMAGVMGGGAAGAAAASPASYAPQPVEPQRSDTVGIGPDDYNGFQAVLANVMGAYSAEDIGGLRRVTTPEMAAHFIRELQENQSRGITNRLGQPTLLQGDLAEAWYEDNVAYATVAIRYSMTDAVLERSSGKVLEGSLSQPQENVEIWTFRRDNAGQIWVLSAQQQA